MNKIFAELTLEHIIENLNKAGRALKKEWTKNGYSTIPTFSKFEIVGRPQKWYYYLDIPENSPNIREIREKYDGNDLIIHFGEFRQGFLKTGAQLFTSLNLSPQYVEILYKDLSTDTAKNLSQQLATQYLKNNFKLTLKQYQKLYDTLPKEKSKPSSFEKYSPKQIITKMRTALREWILISNQLHAVKKIVALMKYMPPEVSEYNGAPLYRGVIVAIEALRKCLKENKPLTYHSREYSSWSPDIDTAEYFAKHYQGAQKGYVPVVLKKTFKPSQVLVDVRKLRKYLGYKEVFPLYEIIIHLGDKDLKFPRDDIFEYMDKGQWVSLDTATQKSLLKKQEEKKRKQQEKQQKMEEKVSRLYKRLEKIVPEINFESHGSPYKEYGQLAIPLIPHFPKNFSKEDKIAAFHKVSNKIRVHDYTENNAVWTLHISA